MAENHGFQAARKKGLDKEQRREETTKQLGNFVSRTHSQVPTRNSSAGEDRKAMVEKKTRKEFIQKHLSKIATD